MATPLLASYPLCSFIKFQPNKAPSQNYSSTASASFRKPVVRCVATNTTQVIQRRTGNYQPCIWDIEFLQTLESDYSGEIYNNRSENLKRQVKTMLLSEVEPLVQLELIDALQRLGLGYAFETEMKNTLDNIYNNRSSEKYRPTKDLHAAALEFRLLRQHHYHVPQEKFESFRDENGFNKSICDDVKGMLSLYEASFFSLEDESILDEAWEFTSEKLKNLRTEDMDPTLAMLVPHALEIPLHWRLPRFDARWFIEVYEKSADMNPILLELAKLDFNIVQALHQDDLRVMSRWWKNIGLREKLDFARDRLVSSFLWGVGVSSLPEYTYSRRIIGMDIAIINMIDDIYDVYGTLDEVELFTDAVEKWDISAMKQLPHYMKIAYLAFYNTVNEMIYHILRDQGVDVTEYLTKAWLGLLKGFLTEARWYYTKHKPSLDEYMKNACVSVAGPLIVSLAYLTTDKSITEEEMKCLESIPDVVHWACYVFRLSDDSGTSSDELKRGDVPKAIQCYMHDTGASEEVARRHLKKLVRDGWKKMNKYRFIQSPLTPTLVEMIQNLARVSQNLYERGDGHGIEDGETKDRVVSLFFQPIPM